MTPTLSFMRTSATGDKYTYGPQDSRIEGAVDFLVRENALELGGSPWRTYEESEDVLAIDWDRLFSSNDQWIESVCEPSLIDSPFVGGLFYKIIEVSNRGGWTVLCPRKPHRGWDVCAWYQPIHFHGYD